MYVLSKVVYNSGILWVEHDMVTLTNRTYAVEEFGEAKPPQVNLFRPFCAATPRRTGGKEGFGGTQPLQTSPLRCNRVIPVTKKKEADTQGRWSRSTVAPLR